jgi:hypothetical protein
VKSGAFSHRELPLIWQSIGMAPSKEAVEGFTQHARELKQELAPYLSGGLYLNFVEGGEAVAHTRDGFSAEAFRRLEEIKARYDPDNCFRYAYDILPEQAHRTDPLAF